MPTFRCKIATQAGRTIEKTLLGSTKASVREELEREGSFVLDIRREEGIGAFLKRGKGRRRIGMKDFLIFNQEFAVLNRAGLPVVSALDAIMEKGAESEFNRVLADIRNEVSGGAALSEAFNKYAHIFSHLYVATLQAGERSGNIELAISRYIDYMKKVAEIRQKIISASVYPVILTMVSVFSVLFLMTYVVPSFTRTYIEAGTQLPEITALLISVSGAIKDHALYIVLAAAALVVGYQYLRQTDSGRHYLDRQKLKVPFLGGIYVHYAVSKLARTLATVLGGGLTLVSAIRISSGTLDNFHLKDRLEEAAAAVEKGAGFSESLASTGAFPSLAVRMMEAGESSGALGQVLDDIADFYESDVDTKLSILTSSIEPALMVVMGLLIGFIVLAMYMPIFQMAATVG